jgi:hypothetical protein
MRQFLSVAVPVVGNFVAWALITLLPVRSLIIFALVITSGLLMIWALAHFARTNKNPST